MTDTDKMPFGIHKDKALVNVPASYLLFLLDKGFCKGELKKYIQDNLEVLKNEINR